MIKVHEIELIFKLPKTDPQLPSKLAGLLTNWVATYDGNIQSHPHSNHPPEFFRLSFVSNNFNVHVSQNQVHLHLNLNLVNEQINSFLFNFYNQYQTVIKDLKTYIPKAQLRVIGKIFYPFKEVLEPADLIKKIHTGLCVFAPQGEMVNFQLHTGYSDKNNIFRFRFQDYQMRQTPPGTRLSMEQLMNYPVVENGIEVLLDLTHNPTVLALESEIVNLFRLLSLNIEALPSHFFNNLTAELKTQGPTFN